MAERHYHRFIPEGGYVGGTERREQYCQCGARRCAATSHGSPGVWYRCAMAARKNEQTCTRHKDRIPVWTDQSKDYSDLQYS